MRCSNAGMSSSISRICTWRCTFTLGARRSRTDVITPNSPYPPIASRNSSAFCSRLQVRGIPSASTSTNDSTSPMNGLNLRPRPWAFAASAPPILKRSAPVCFWRMPHARAAPCCASTRCRISSGHWTPASTSIRPRAPSKPITRFIEPISTSVVSLPNCCPPMACRPPAIPKGRPSCLALRTSCTTASAEAGFTTRCTRVALSCEWMSLTTTPGADRSPAQPYGARATPAPAAAPASRNSRRVSMEPPQAKKQEPQGHRLDEMVQRVVIEVRGMQRDPRLLYRGRDEHEAEPCNGDQDAPLPRACIRDGQRDQQEHDGREIENHRRAELLRDEQREDAIGRKRRGGGDSDAPRRGRGEQHPRADRPGARRRDADRDQGEAPEDRVPQRAGIQEEAVDRPSSERRDGGGPEEEGVLFTLEQIGEDGALDRERVVRESDVGLGHPAGTAGSETKGRVW